MANNFKLMISTNEIKNNRNEIHIKSPWISMISINFNWNNENIYDQFQLEVE